MIQTSFGELQWLLNYIVLLRTVRHFAAAVFRTETDNHIYVCFHTGSFQ